MAQAVFYAIVQLVRRCFNSDLLQIYRICDIGQTKSDFYNTQQEVTLYDNFEPEQDCLIPCSPLQQPFAIITISIRLISLQSCQIISY